MKKTIIILIIILIILGIVYFVFLKNNSNNLNTQSQNASLPVVSTTSNTGNTTDVLNQSSSDQTQDFSYNTQVMQSSSLRASDVYNNIPNGQTFNIGTPNGMVQVNNFYLSDPLIAGEGGSLLVDQNSNYITTYDPTTGSFWIIINGTPFDSFRTVAEQDLLKLLNISKSDACKLIVYVSAPYDVQNPSSFKQYPLSFCSK